MPTPNRGWVTDITYVWTPEGWLYLAVILDLFSRRVVGWSLSVRLERGIALDALKMALQDRQPPQGLLHHSDRGSQYASHDYQQLLAVHGIQSSMSRKGNCWDNAVAESFFATLKVELVYQRQWSTRTQARSELFEYIELFYNRQRRHSALGYLCPTEFERLAIRHALQPVLRFRQPSPPKVQAAEDNVGHTHELALAPAVRPRQLDRLVAPFLAKRD